MFAAQMKKNCFILANASNKHDYCTAAFGVNGAAFKKKYLCSVFKLSVTFIV